jgi:hypothetical protein
MARKLALLAAAIAVMAAGTPPASGAAATPIRAHFEYDLFDPAVGVVHFSCDEVRLLKSEGARESIHCATTDSTHASAIIFTPDGNLFGGFPWFSDFTGEPAADFHLVGTPSGRLDGWATY